VFAVAERHGAKTVDHSDPGELGIQIIADLLLRLGIPELG